jgi:iron complex transport system substrate-binding protein
VGWETIAKANPTLIVIAKMDRRRFPADDFEKKLEFLKSDPVASQMDAVKNNRIVVMDAHAMDATMRTVSGIEVLADALVDQGIAR